jgi:hypothetical protein
MPSLPRPSFALPLAALSLALAAAPAAAQESDRPVYREPDPALVRIVDAPPTPGVSLSPAETRMLLLAYPSYPRSSPSAS